MAKVNTAGLRISSNTSFLKTERRLAMKRFFLRGGMLMVFVSPELSAIYRGGHRQTDHTHYYQRERMYPDMLKACAAHDHAPADLHQMAFRNKLTDDLKETGRTL